MKTSVIAWTRYDRRPDLVAQHLGTTAQFVSYGRRGPLLTTPARYAAQWLRTWEILRAARPDIVFVQNPAIFCVLADWLYPRR